MSQALSRQPLAVPTPLNPSIVRVSVLVFRVEMQQTFFPPTFFAVPVTANPPMLHTYLYLRVALTRRTSGGKYGNLPESYALSEVGELWMEKFLVFKWLNSVIHGLCVYVCVCCKLTK